MKSTPESGAGSTRVLPECWGHRGASATYPENTLASFERAIRDGSEAIESDVHVSLDNVVVMFHDPELLRTTGVQGTIKETNWYGGMDGLRTLREPRQSIPTFAETVELLMKPENKHVKFDVDVKVQNEPERLFGLMNSIISAHPNWEKDLAPRIILGLWHPKFLKPAETLLPYCRRSHIGHSPVIARKHFWNSCDAFSLSFRALATSEGEKFRKDCKAAGKQVFVWTVNDPKYMSEAVRWGVDAIITDVTKTWLDLRAQMQDNYDGVISQQSRLFLWTDPSFYTLLQQRLWQEHYSRMLRLGGPFEIV